jgi:acyl-CoA thioesterase 8
MFGSFVLRFKNVSSAASCSKSRFLSTLNNPIDLEKLDVDLFRSKHLWKPSGARAVYGGQVVGQAVAASTQCVTNKKVLNSLHAYFIKGGDPDVPIIYRVRRLNTTNNFEMHSISAKQNGQTIFHCQASYHRPEESPLFHERSMPSAPDPESLISQEDQLKAMLEDPRLPDSSRLLISERLKTPFAIDVRDVTPYNIFEPDSRPPNKLVWMRTRVPLEESDSSMQQCFAAFASDWGLAGASLLPHKLYFGHPKMKVSGLYLM